jgi:YD repeat-containing protein
MLKRLLDGQGMVKSVTVVGEGTYTFGYDALGRNNSLTYPDGHQRTQGYDPEGRLQSRCYVYTNGAPSRCYGATYDAAGNPETLTDPKGTDVLQYDSINRVTSSRRQVAGQADVLESYAYNAMGALSTNAPETTGNALDDQRSVLGGSGSAPSAVMNAVNGAIVTLDPAGQVTGLAGATLAYNKQNRLRSIKSGSSTETETYDALLRRASRVTSTSTEVYVYDGSTGANVLARLCGTGAVVDRFMYDGIDSPMPPEGRSC